MNTFIKDNWFKISLLVIIVVAIGGWFYWSQWRPEQIRKKCYDLALSISFESPVETNYNACLLDHGLEK